MIIPVILAGGSGTRLWPTSRKSYPKQFTQLVGDNSLFQDTAQRLLGRDYAAPTVVTSADFRFLVAEQLDQIGAFEGAQILLEPAARNTAPAILAAALRHENTPEALLLVSPADHRIEDASAFRRGVIAAAKEARTGKIVTFGLQPTHPETGYGYLQLSESCALEVPQPLQGFVEKPDLATAQAYLEDGQHLWNAGIFMFSVETILEAFAALAPEMVAPCRASLETGKEDLGFLRLGAEAYARCKDISIDYAIMEASEALSVVPLDCGWTDLGSWRSVHAVNPQDPDGNALTGEATQIDCRNTLLRSDRSDMRLVGLGLENIAAIATDDAVLVASLDDSERVKEVVAELKMQQVTQAESFRRCHRPWGYYETLALGERFQVKRIMVKPGGRLSLQSHVHRSEHWVVVEGTAHVTIDETGSIVTENQSIYIPLGSVHRLENKGKVPLNLIEVQSGTYLGEDDITRYEDLYDRAPVIAPRLRSA